MCVSDKKIYHMNIRQFLIIIVIVFCATTSIGDSAGKMLIANCDYSGTRDQSACVQKYLDLSVKNNTTIYFNNGILLISKPILLRHNTNLIGNKTIFKPNFTKSSQCVFYGDSVSGIIIKNIEITGNGRYLPNKFISNYTNFNHLSVIGYSNLDKGICISGKSSNVSLNNLKMSGVERGIEIDNGNINSNKLIHDVLISNNVIKNVGEVGIRVINTENVKINNNIVDRVLGNMDFSGDPKLANVKFADGIYLSGVKNADINFNQITDVRRIGIVLEGEEVNHKVLNKNENVKIIGNKIYNVNNCRGTENNAAIWVEPSASAEDKYSYKTGTVTIENNMINNAQNATGCVNNQYGLFLGGKYNIVKNNTIINFKALHNYAINCNYGKIILNNNKLNNNRSDMFINPNAYYIDIQQNH